jgi:hypothetical protein
MRTAYQAEAAVAGAGLDNMDVEEFRFFGKS